MGECIFQTRKHHANAPIRTIPIRDRQSIGRTTRYNRGTPDLYPQQSKTFSLVLTIRPRFVGLAARPRAATLPINSCPQLCIWQSWRPLRSSSGDCGARAGGTGSAGYAVRSRRALPPTKRGREHRTQATCHNSAKKVPALAAAHQAVLINPDP